MPDTSGQGGEQGGGMGGEQAAQGGRPGGGLGNPIDTPDPLTRYKWPILLGMAVVLLFGGFYIVTHRQHGETVETPNESPEHSSDRAAQEPSRVAAPSHSELLLEAMKEELFQLELDRQQGKISPEEYAKAKQALDATLRRAITRSRDAQHAGA